MLYPRDMHGGHRFMQVDRVKRPVTCIKDEHPSSSVDSQQPGNTTGPPTITPSRTLHHMMRTIIVKGALQTKRFSLWDPFQKALRMVHRTMVFSRPLYKRWMIHQRKVRRSSLQIDLLCTICT